MRAYLTIIVAAFTYALTSLAFVQADVDYGNLDHWLCHADNANYCAQDQSATWVHASGDLVVKSHTPLAAPDVDCFYVYPTVSSDPAGNSDMIANEAEAGVIRVQFARFSSVCRTFAPLYRQVTLTALRARIAGQSMDVDPTLGFKDVTAAWQHYLKHENNGRGVILIGHSQGTGVLTELIRTQIEGQPIQQRVIAAYLIGTANVLVPPGRDVGGTFKHMPLCRQSDQSQCIVSFASFRDTLPPPSNARFGQARNPNQRNLQTACNLPGALSGGKAELHAYLASQGDNLASSSAQPAWTSANPEINTPFVYVPGLISGECITKDGFSYLSVTVNADPNDPRADDIAGDVVIEERIAKDWGLHLIDMHLTMGNLVTLAKQQSKAYLGQH